MEEILSVLWVLVCTVAVLALCYYVTRRLTRLPALSRYAGGFPGRGGLRCWPAFHWARISPWWWPRWESAVFFSAARRGVSPC